MKRRCSAKDDDNVGKRNITEIEGHHGEKNLGSTSSDDNDNDNDLNNLESDSQSSNLVIDSSIESESSDNPTSDNNLEQNEAIASNALPRLRQFKSLPTFVVDYHHHVLEFIYRCIGSRYLPVDGNMLIHFDSHPDMVISHDIVAKDTFNKNVMLEQTSIESWIMPLCYTGIVTRIVWIKNAWCNQITIGKHDFQIGEYKGKLYVDVALPYFLAEGNYCETKDLSNARSIELFVLNATELDAYEDLNKLPEAINFFKSDEDNVKPKQMPYILDIDLDFFSVNNPFLSMYEKSHCYEQLSKIFAFEVSDMDQIPATSINQRRIEQLQALKHIFQHLEKHLTLENYEKPEDVPEIDGKSFDLLQKLIESLKDQYASEEIKWMLIYDAGCTADSGGLPHHSSTQFELMKQYKLFRRFLHKLHYLPIAVTIARSAEDNYCPADQVSSIQEEVIRGLDAELGGKLNQRVIYAYLDEEYNIMEL